MCISIAGVQIASADGDFQNNLLNANVSKNFSGGLSLNLYTSKPYSEPVMVNKKSDNEYVILLPETSNSLFSKPNIKSASDVVKSVDVKTQQYQDKMKGYTKIIISTQKPVEIIPHVSTVKSADYKLRDKDYQELIAKASAKKESKVAPQKAVPNKKSIMQNKPTQSQSAQTHSAITKVAKSVKKESTVQPQKPVKKVGTGKIMQKTKIPVVSKVNKTKSQVQIKKPIVEQVKPAKVETKPTVASVENKPKALSEREEKMLSTKPPVEPKIDMTLKPQSTQPIVVDKFAEYKSLIKNNLILVSAVGLLVFLLLLSIARNISKNANKNKKIFTENLNEEPVKATDYTQNITEDMNWKEKYNAYLNSSSSEFEEPESQVQKDSLSTMDAVSEQELDDLFSGEYPEETGFDSAFEEEAIVDNFANLDENDYSDLTIDDMFSYADDVIASEDLTAEQVFGEDEEEPQITPIEEAYAQPIEEEETFSPKPVEAVSQAKDEIIKSEFIIDDTKGLYLVDYEDTTALVGQVNDDIFVLKKFDEKINKKLQARVNEKTSNSVNYMTKVGDFKGIVEVTPSNMKLLIEL